MCGRFTQANSQKAMLNRFLVKITNEEVERLSRPRYNIAPSQVVPVVLKAQRLGQGRELRAMQWGLIPKWAKDAKMKVNTINARAEGIETSPVYREAFKQTRCVVPATGYYEWKKGTSPKQPYYIYPSERGEMFAMAGLWDRWMGPGGVAVDSFTLMTTAANEVIARVHHRMPVLLTDEEISLWLGEQTGSLEALRAILKPREFDCLQMHPVSPRVNKVTHDQLQNLEPYEILEFDF